MAHVFVGVEARKIWMDRFRTDLERRRYPYESIKGGTSFVQPNVREVKLFDITLPEDCMPYLMQDLQPVMLPASGKKKLILKIVRLFTRLIGRFTGFRTVTGDFEPSGQVQAHWINKIVLGWMKDDFEPHTKRNMLPKGGELI